jgi:soluble lytic murein transglycosylase-like protein
MRFLALLLVMAAGASAGEYVVFASGSRLRVDRHETAQTSVRLFAGDAWFEVDPTWVLRYEAEESAAPEPAASPVTRLEPYPTSAAAVTRLEPYPTSATPAGLADAAADRYGLPRQLVRSVMAAESAYQPRAVSPKGAIGLMQLMPSTAQALGANPYDPFQNVDAGAHYLRDLLTRYDNRLWHALAAYNAGPEAVDKYNGVPPYPETINYVSRIDRDLREKPEPASSQ